MACLYASCTSMWVFQRRGAQSMMATSAIGSAANAPTTARSAPLLPPVAEAVLEERVLDPVPLGDVAVADAEVDVAVPFKRIALRYTEVSNFARHPI